MTLIDNVYGVTAMAGIEADKVEIVIKDSFIYGESEARDCIKQNFCNESTGP